MDSPELSTDLSFAERLGISGMVDMHVHASPSLLPRHATDSQVLRIARGLGFETIVLKSHEGSTVERAAIAGKGAVGGVVLNSPVGGANPDAVETAARLGGRVVWMPTVSAATHQLAADTPELKVHDGFKLRRVVVVKNGRLLKVWQEVLEVIAAHDLVLASGHLSAHETSILFQAAKARGVNRLLVNHPMMPFLGWNEQDARILLGLGAHLEVGILPDRLGPQEKTSLHLVGKYPTELLVLGADLGHAAHPTMSELFLEWFAKLEARAGEDGAREIVTTNGRRLLS